jgi:hypothetical protein
LVFLLFISEISCRYHSYNMGANGQSEKLYNTQFGGWSTELEIRTSFSKFYGMFSSWSHSMLHEVMHHKFIPSILVESTYSSCIY